MSHPVRIDRIGEIDVVRDDLLPGGSKQRVLAPIMRDLMREGYDEFVFGGPAEGYAQLALAFAAAEIGARATYFVAQRRVLHPNSVRAQAAGARIMPVAHGRLNVVQARAREYCREQGAYFFPLGFATPEFEGRLSVEIASALAGSGYREVWCVAGSGLLSRCLQAALPSAAHYAVRIGFPPDVGRATLLTAPEQFSEEARIRPPFPSSPNYDAKAWQFVERLAQPGALFWNVGA